MRNEQVCAVRWAVKLSVTALVLSFGSGCASTSLFNAYPRQVGPIIQAVKDGIPVDPATTFATKVQSQDKILYLMERGRVAQIQGQTDASMRDFKAAIDVIKENDRKAVLTVSGGGAKTAAVLVNDNTIPYKGEGYEHVFLHHYQAWNYLAKNDLEGARVELRLADAEQDAALKEHAKEVKKAVRDAKAQQVNVPLENPDFARNFAAMDKAAGMVKNSFQNAYTFYMSGVVREILKEENDAYIDYKKALEIFPNNDYLQCDVLRLAINLGMGDDLERFKVLYPAAYKVVAEGGVNVNLGISEDEFNTWLEKMRVPFEKNDKTAFRSVIANFRSEYAQSPERSRIENALFAQLKTASKYASWFNNGAKWGITGDEFNAWLARLRPPHEQNDKEALKAVITEFRSTYSNNLDAAQIEKALVARLKAPPADPAAAPASGNISEADFNTWLEKLRAAHEAGDKAAIQAVVAAFRETYKTCPDVGEAERALVKQLKIAERRKTLVFGLQPVPACELVVLFEDDFVPQKREVKIPIPIAGAKTIVAVAFPVYDAEGATTTPPLSVFDNRAPIGDTQPICYVGAIALKALKENMPAIVVRQMIRVTAKTVASKAINDQVTSKNFMNDPKKTPQQNEDARAVMGALASIGTSIFNLVTENADLRSWTTLPKAAQIMRTTIPLGENSIEFVHNASGATAKVDVTAKPGGKVLVLVTRTGGKFYCNSMNF